MDARYVPPFLPTVTVYLVPPDTEQRVLEQLARNIQAAVAEALHLDLPEKEVTVLFPADLLTWGIGSELSVFLDGICRHEHSPESRQILIESVMELIYKFALTHVPACKEVKLMLRGFALGQTDLRSQTIER